jgi:hypothetical protein
LTKAVVPAATISLAPPSWRGALERLLHEARQRLAAFLGLALDRFGIDAGDLLRGDGGDRRERGNACQDEGLLAHGRPPHSTQQLRLRQTR